MIHQPDYYALYPKDVHVPDYYGTRPKRRKPCEFGFNSRIDNFGQFLRQQNDIIDWNLRRRYHHLRDQFTYSSRRFDKTYWGVPISDSTRIDAAQNFFSRGGKSITYTCFNFTREALDVAPPSISQAYLARYHGNKDHAAKAILHAGCAAGDKAMRSFATAHAQEFCNRLSPLKGTRTRVERENELRWQPTSVWNTVSTPTRSSNFEFSKSIGWTPVNQDPLDFTDVIFEQSGLEIAPKLDVHAYHTWLIVGKEDGAVPDDTDPPDRMTQFYHGYEGTPESFEVREAQGTNKMPADEIKRVVLDCWARGATIIYNHTPALVGAGLYYYNDRWAFYSQYKNAEGAKALLKTVVNPVPEHEGRCVLDPAADHAWNTVTEALSFV